MADVIKIDELAKTVMDTMAEMLGATNEVVAAAVKETATEARNELRQTSPRGTRPAAESYQRSWSIKNASGKDGVYGTVVYSKQPQLTHLLEFGHAKVGQKGGRTAAQPHIAPAEQHAAERLEQLIREGINDIK